ncbi:F-box domain-containing protein [Mycena chlorophos]|uniref:F-box domain-containing protein n=1 Tax=Mycena chlorophos TaxID=658473 RepID=A0A8H6W597_MYCCL|nr:F-box domain-containing protein [Mycena chlorophos]
MRRLPAELLQEIFVQCLPRERNPAMCSLEAPVLLGRICRHWRNLALATPALWARLHIAEPFTSYMIPVTSIAVRRAKLQQRADAARAWLDRANEHPLSISFHQDADSSILPVHMNEEPTHEDPDPKMMLLRLILRYAARWEKVDLALPILEDDALPAFEALNQLTGADVPILKSFRLKATVWSSGDNTAWDSLELLRASQLTRLAVGFCGSISHLHKLPVSWERLTTLDLSEVTHADISPAGVLGVLDKCTGLRSCTLEIPDSTLAFGAAAATLLPLTSTICPELRSLEFSGTFALLSRMTCPQLQHLSVGSRSPGTIIHEPPDMPPYNDYLRHIISSTTSLETFRYRVLNAAENADLAALLEFLPQTLVGLHLTESSGHPQIDDELMAKIGSRDRFPRLETLTLRQCELLSSDGIAEFLANMKEMQSSSLRRLKVHFSTPVDDLEVDRLQSLAGEEMKVVIKGSRRGSQFSPYHGLRLTHAEAFQIYGNDGFTPEDDEDFEL